MPKYDPLRAWLGSRTDDRPGVSFGEIEAMVGGLPRSATDHRAWWSNDPGHVRARAWLGAGFRVESVDLRGARVRFRRWR